MRGFRFATLALAVVVGVAAAILLACPVPIPTENPKAIDKPAGAKSVEPADNSYCLVCHLNYENEKLTKGHRIAGVSCAKCHGESEKHSGDEDGLTPPEIMFAKSGVDKYCITCHPEDKVLEYDRKKKTEYHKDVFDPKAEDHLICTECHGENHRMAVRTRLWDKNTRKLISDDGVRMMYKDSPATEGVKAPDKKPK